MSTPSRAPAGTPVGGQFAPGQHGESPVSVGVPAPLSVDDQRMAGQANAIIAQQDRINELYREIHVAREKLAEDSVRLMSELVRRRYPDADTINCTCSDENNIVGFEGAYDDDGEAVLEGGEDDAYRAIPGASRRIDLDELASNLRPVSSVNGFVEDFSIVIDDELGRTLTSQVSDDPTSGAQSAAGRR